MDKKEGRLKADNKRTVRKKINRKKRDKRGIEDGPKTDKYQMDDRRRIDRRQIKDG